MRIGGLNEADPDLAIANMKALHELAGQGRLKPRISHRLPLAQAAEAHRLSQSGHARGKIVLTA